MRKPLVIGCCAILVGIVAVLLVGLFDVPRTKSPVGSCRQMISEIYFMLEIIANDHDKEIATLLDRGAGNDTHHLVLNTLREHATASTIRLPHYVGETAIIDPWGRPLNVKWVDELPADTNIPRHPSSLCIWSSGENGINEYGANDDVVLFRRSLAHGDRDSYCDGVNED